jgi:hypothetical protein
MNLVCDHCGGDVELRDWWKHECQRRSEPATEPFTLVAPESPVRGRSYVRTGALDDLTLWRMARSGSACFKCRKILAWGAKCGCSEPSGASGVET